MTVGRSAAFAARGRWARVRPTLVAIGAMAVGLLVFGSAVAAPASAASNGHTSGRLLVRVTGLPAGQRPAVVVTGPGVHERLRSERLVVAHARAGQYLVDASAVRTQLAPGRRP
jgi:hypothetical protein